MNVMLFLFFGWIFYLTAANQTDESISFSPASKDYMETSYWNGNITIPNEISFLEAGIFFQLHLNEFQGLLFYTIDNKYRTFWVEFDKNILKINFFNFLIEDVHTITFKLDELCINYHDRKINIMFTTKDKYFLINCNGNKQQIDYTDTIGSLSPAKFVNFLSSMYLPIPTFNNETQNNTVHIWIGNAPLVKDENYRNVAQLKSYSSNLWGCVKLFTINNAMVKLASTGVHYGKMLTPFCKPLCNSDSCYNNGSCNELWRGRFSCNCSFSHFTGKLCEKNYAIQFDGTFSVPILKYMQLEKLKFSFNSSIYKRERSEKLISLELTGERYLVMYIDNFNSLHVLYKFDGEPHIDETFNGQIMDEKMYNVFIDVVPEGIHMKIFDSKRKYIVDQRTIKIKSQNLILINTIVGDSHLKFMGWMLKFNGCITNFVMKSNKKQFTWNEIENFETYPKCGVKPNITTIASNSRIETLKNKAKNGVPMTPDENNSLISSAFATYLIVIVVSLIVLVLIIGFVIYKCRNSSFARKKEQHSDQVKMIPQSSYAQKPPIDVYPSMYMTNTSSKSVSYKPAYTARSMSGSVNGRSMTSLPMSTSPTLVTPEEVERASYYNTLSNSYAPKVKWKLSKTNCYEDFTAF